MKRHIIFLPLVVAMTLAPITPAPAIIVYDPTNYVQNALQAARALQQINQQIQALQNQATMIAAMMRNLDHLNVSSVGAITNQLTSLQRLIAQGQGISAASGAIDQRIAALFPKTGLTSVSQGSEQAHQRMVVQMSSFQDSLKTQARILRDVGDDQATLAAVAGASQRAGGNLAVSQATNQLLALAAKQQAQLQTMLAVHFQADALNASDQLQKHSDAQAAMRRFLGSGQAYTAN
jgi:P-type conjugative transfer protein TrbJ